MNTRLRNIFLATSLIVAFWSGSAAAASVDGIAVGGLGSSFKSMVGIDPASLSAPNTGKIKYFIPLDDGTENTPVDSGTTGTYGVTPITCGNGSAGFAGTCSDTEDGAGYANADALTMNIFFDLTGEPEAAAASLDFVFDDLDLVGINDPNSFLESMTLSYWDGSNNNPLGSGTILNPSQLTSDFTGASANISSIDPITWSLDLGLAGLAILGDLNNTRASDNGFWIQLGFGSQYIKDAKNTAEYLTATLNVSPVPLPSAVWLFGSALLGFIGMSRRTRI